MKKTLLIFSIAFINPLLHNLLAQEDFATIEKNVNVDASHLFHDLNKTKDTLLLKSDEKITYVYSINKDHKREINYYSGKQTFKVPLTNLSKGRHVFVVGLSPLKIVFVIRIFGKITTLASVGDN